MVALQSPAALKKGHDRFWWLLPLTTATFLPRRVFHLSAAVCAPCRRVQGKVMCPCPQGWVLCLAMQESRGMCQADTCTGGTGEQVNCAAQMQTGICTMCLLLWRKRLRSFGWSNFVRSIPCLHPTELDTAATLTQAASGLEEEENNTIYSAYFFHVVWWLRCEILMHHSRSSCLTFLFSRSMGMKNLSLDHFKALARVTLKISILMRLTLFC